MKKLLILPVLILAMIAASAVGLAGCAKGSETVEPITLQLIAGAKEIVYEVTAAPGTALAIPTARKGMGCAGVYEDAARQIASQLPVKMPGDKGELVKYYGVWDGTYTIRYEAGRGVGLMDERIVKFDESVKLDANRFNLRGEEFQDWTVSGVGGGSVSKVDGAIVYNLADKAGDVVTLTARFDQLDAENFTVENGIVTAYTGSAEKVKFPTSATRIAPSVFGANAADVKKIVVPSCYTEIARGAFANCEKLEQLYMPFIGGSRTDNGFLAYVFGAEKYQDNVYSFSASIYQGMYLKQENFVMDSLFVPETLTKVAITDPVTRIGEGAFAYAYALENVVFYDADAVTSIGARAFEACPNLGFDALLQISNRMNFLSNATEIGAYAFKAYISVENAEGGSYIFSNLRQISPLAKARAIGNEAFYGCVYLEEVTFGEQLRTIGESAFLNNASLTKLTIPDRVTDIKDMAFMSCASVVELALGKNIVEIGTYAFANMAALGKVTVNAIDPPMLGRASFCNELQLSSDSYIPVFDAMKFYLSADTVSDYLASADWKVLGDYFVTWSEAESVVYYGAKGDGGFDASLTIANGLVVVVDPEHEFLTMIDYIGSLGKLGTEYTLLIEEADVPANVVMQGDEVFYTISHPDLTNVIGQPAPVTLRVRSERYTKVGKEYLIPVAEIVGEYYFSTMGKDDKDGLWQITGDKFGHFALGHRETAKDAQGKPVAFTPVEMPDGAVRCDLATEWWYTMSREIVRLDYYDANYRLIESKRFLEFGGMLIECGADVGFKGFYSNYPYEVVFDGCGNAKLAVPYMGKNTEMLGKYAVSDGQTVGQENFKVSLFDVVINGKSFTGTVTLSGYFDKMYHKCEVLLQNPTEFSVNTVVYVYSGMSSEVTTSNAAGDSFTLYTYVDSKGEVAARYAELEYMGGVKSHGVYTESVENGQLVYTITMKDSEPVKAIVEDKRGAMTIGNVRYVCYDSSENGEYELGEYVLPGVEDSWITYYTISMDGYGNALFHDEHDDGFDDYYVGTYYNTGRVVGENDYGDLYVYVFEGYQCDGGGEVLPNAKSYTAYFVADFDYGYLLLVSLVKEFRSEILDQKGYKIAEMDVDPFGITKITLYTYSFDANGNVVYKEDTENSARVTAVSYQYGDGSLAYVVVKDLSGQVLFLIEKDGEDWVRVDDISYTIRDPENKLIFPDVDKLTPAN